MMDRQKELRDQMVDEFCRLLNLARSLRSLLAATGEDFSSLNERQRQTLDEGMAEIRSASLKVDDYRILDEILADTNQLQDEQEN